jgi:hypothetical protein
VLLADVWVGPQLPLNHVCHFASVECGVDSKIGPAACKGEEVSLARGETWGWERGKGAGNEEREGEGEESPRKIEVLCALLNCIFRRAICHCSATHLRRQTRQ